MVTREVFEANIGEIIRRYRVIDKDIKITIENIGNEKKEEKSPNIEFAPNYCSEIHEINN